MTSTLKQLISEKRYDLLLLALALFFPLYKYAFSSVILIVFSVVSIGIYLKRTSFTLKFRSEAVREFLITTGYFLFLILTLSYTSNLASGWRSVQYGLYVLIFPLIMLLFVGDVTKEHLRFLLNCFIVACVAYAFYIHLWFFEAGLFTNFRPAEISDLPFRDVVMKLKYASSHPTYSSMWFLFAALVLINSTLKDWRSASIGKLVMWMLTAAFLIGTSVLLSSKVTSVALAISLMLLFYTRIANKKWMITSLVVIMIIFVWSIFNISFLKARFVDEYMLTEFKPPVGFQTNSLNIRVGVYQCFFELFREHWLFGVGIGDIQDSLNGCYTQFDTDVYKNETYNTHNNYFDFALGGGIIALGLFLFMLTWHLKRAVKAKNFLFFVFLLFMMICFTGENILSRNHGVIFFSLIGSLFIKRNFETLDKKNVPGLNDIIDG